MKRIGRFFKRNLRRITTVFCAVSVGIFSALCPFTVSARADVVDYVDYVFDSWENVPDDLNALGEAYINTVKRLPKNVQTGDFLDFFNNISDIPKNWVKLVGDSQFVLSPVNGVRYLLGEDGSLVREDVNEGGSQGRRRFEDVKDLTIDGETFKKVYERAANRYTPAPDINRLTVSYQNSNDAYKKWMTDDDYGVHSFDFPLYAYGDTMSPHKTQFFGQGWSEFYFLPFVNFNNAVRTGSFYYDRYFRLKLDIRNEFTETWLVLEVFSFSGGELLDTYEVNVSSFILKYHYYSFFWGTFSGPAGYTDMRLLFHDSYADMSARRTFVNNFALGYSSYYNENQDIYFYSGSLDSLQSFSSFLGAKVIPDFDTSTDDFGFICQTEPFEFFYKKNPVDTTKIPDNYAITYGDDLYDYSVTNTETGDTNTFNDYINNNYEFTINVGGGGSGSGSGSGGTTSGNVSVGGDVTVGGKVDIGGKVEFSPVEIKPIDINVNVSGSSGGTSGGGSVGDYIDESGAATSIDPYLDRIPEVSKGFTDYLKDFFTWLPKEVYGLIVLGLLVAIWCRIAGR